MRPHALQLGLAASLAAAVGTGAAAAAFAGGAIPPAAGAAGALLALAAVAVQARSAFATGSLSRAFRERLEAGTGQPLAEPFESLAAQAAQVLGALKSDVDARAAEARRARLGARAQQAEHAAFKSLLDNLGDGVLLFDGSQAATVANRAARRFLGLAESDPLPRGTKELATLVRRAALRPILEKALAGAEREALKTRDVDVSDPEERLVLRMQFQEIAGEPGKVDGQPPQLAIVMRDVTREVELTRMKSDFASSVSHELKTPLCSMRAFLEMLVDGDIEGEEAQREHLKMVLDQTDRLTGLVQNLLNLSRLEAGITKMARDAVQLADVLHHIEEVVAPLAKARQQSLAFEVSGFLPPVTGDAAMLEQAALNLVSNAIKYTPEGGSVRVIAGLAGREVEMRVVDTGVGIPAKALHLIFEKFTRIENHCGLKATGCGLGLPLAKFVAEAHGGRIQVTSEVGKGSEFRMSLPLRRASDNAEAVLVGLEGIGS